MSIELKELVVLQRNPASLSDIQAFEQEHTIIIPDQYKQLLMLSDGVEVGGQFPHPREEGWNLRIVPYLYSLAGLKDTFFLFEDLAEMGFRLQDQDKILKIGYTHDGPDVLMGWAGNLTGKIFIAELDDMIVDNEIPLYQVADSLVSFLRMLK